MYYNNVQYNNNGFRLKIERRDCAYNAWRGCILIYISHLLMYAQYHRTLLISPFGDGGVVFNACTRTTVIKIVSLRYDRGHNYGEYNIFTTTMII